MFVDRRVEGFLDLAGGAGKFEYGAAVGYGGDLESVGLQPGGDFLDVLVGGAELLAELLWREPLMVVRRGLVLLLVEQLFERGFLLRTALQDQEHAGHRETGRSGAAIVFGAGQVVRVALEDGEISLVHRLGDARRSGSGLRGRVEGEKQRKESKKQKNAQETRRLGSHGFVHLGSRFGTTETAGRIDGSYEKCQVVRTDSFLVMQEGNARL